MSPFGLVSSSMAVLQAAERLSSLITLLEDLANASEDIASLKQEISNMKTAIKGVQSISLSTQATKQSQGSLQSLSTFLRSVSRLETLTEKVDAKKKMLGSEKGTDSTDILGLDPEEKEA